MLRSTLIAIAAALMFGAAPSIAETLTAGANIGNVPLGISGRDRRDSRLRGRPPEGSRQGLGYDKVDIQNIPFNGLFSAVQSGRIDVAISSITITDERLKSVSFAQPYYDSDQSLCGQGGFRHHQHQGPEGQGRRRRHRLDRRHVRDERKDDWGLADIRRYEGLNPAMLDLAAGRIDAYVSDIPAVAYYLKDKPEMNVVERLKTGEQYSMMFAKDSPLASKANDVLTTLKKEGFIADLHKKWFGTDARGHDQHGGGHGHAEAEVLIHQAAGRGAARLRTVPCRRIGSVSGPLWTSSPPSSTSTCSGATIRCCSKGCGGPSRSARFRSCSAFSAVWCSRWFASTALWCFASSRSPISTFSARSRSSSGW